MLLLKHPKVSALFIILSVVYIVQALLAKPDSEALQKYDLTATHLKLLALTIVLPYVLIWFIALVGYLRLKVYAESIAKSKDGQAFTVIVRGVLLLAVWLPVTAVANSLASDYYQVHPEATAGLTIFINYLNLILLLSAFWLLDHGAKQLMSLTKSAARAPNQKLVLGYLCFAALYVWLVLSDSARRVPTEDVETAVYYQPDWLIITTIVIPRLVMWFWGVQAIQNIYFYAQKVKGSIYKQALGKLGWGLGGVVAASIVLHAIQSLSASFSQLSLALVLLIVYSLLTFIGVGYVLIAKGAKSLQRIEEASLL